MLSLFILGWCSISVNFDWAMMDTFVNRISYLYANCRSDIEWLQEVMTPETIADMDQTCAASIIAITKIKEELEQLKWKVWNNALISGLISKINELLDKLENSRNQIINMYNANILQWSLDNLLDWMMTEEELSNWLWND